MLTVAITTLPGNKGKVTHAISHVVRFKREILPGEKFIIKTKVKSWSRGICIGSGKGYVNKELACEAEMTITIPEILEKNFVEFNNSKSAFKLGFWYENFSPEINYEQSYLWYSVSVSGGIYKAMKLRDRVGEEIEAEKIVELQTEAEEIFTKNKYFNEKKNTEGNI